MTGISLTPEQYDLVWADLDVGEHVYPLTVRSHGATYAERDALRRRVHAQLAARGLAHDGRPADELAGPLVLLARAPVWLDMVWLAGVGDRHARAAVVARSGDDAVLARSTDDPDGPPGLHLRRVRGTAALLALLDLLPPALAGTGQVITLPRSALAPPEREQRGVLAPARRSGRYAAELGAFEALVARPRLRGGQVAANSRTRDGGRRRSRTLDWFDTADGRWLLTTSRGGDGEERLTVAPVDTTRFAHRLRDAVDGLLG